MEQTRYITAGSLIDGSGSDVRKNVFLAVKDVIISGIGPAANLPSTNGAVIDDCSQCIIVPPLVDASVFLSRTPSVDPGVRLAVEEAGIAAKATLAAQHVRYCFSHGVLGVAASDDSIGLAEYLQKVIDPGIPVVIRTSGQPCRRHPLPEPRRPGAAAVDPAAGEGSTYSPPRIRACPESLP